MKNLLNWLNVNKICLNISETEVVSFKSSRKLTDVPLNSNLMGKNWWEKFDENLNWNEKIKWNLTWKNWWEP